MPRIAILGGGIAGLSTACELTRRGETDFILYEASNRLGGIVETVRQDGFVIECGPDSWVTEKPWARDLAIELGLETQLLSSNDAHRVTYLLEDGKLIPMPSGMRMMVPADLDAIDESPLFTESARRAYREEPSRAAELKAFAAARPPDADESVASFVERHFGPEVTGKIAAPLLSGVFGGDIRQLSAAAVMAPFLKFERDHGSLILGLRQQRRAAEPAPVFTTLSNGLQSLVDAMAAVIPPSAIRCSRPVVAVVPTQGKWEVVTAASRSLFDQVVIATPVHIARQWIAPFHPELAALLAIEATSSVVAAFAFDREAAKSLTIPQGFGFLVPQRPESAAEPQLLACTFVNRKFDHRTPDGCVLLRAFYGGDSAPPLLDQADENILALASRQLSVLAGTGPSTPSPGSRTLAPDLRASLPKNQTLPKAQFALVRRWPKSLPQYTVGHRIRVSRVEAIVRETPGLHLIGNAFRGVGLPDLIRHGRDTAAKLCRSPKF